MSPARLALWSLCALLATLAGSSACSGINLPCGVANCTGCCDASGSCRSGNVPSACGIDGISCATCNSGDRCTLGACTPQPGTGGGIATGSCGACAGCCAGSVCVPSSAQTSALCGANAVDCNACSLGALCTDGICVQGGTGGSGNSCATCTSGCCDSNSVCQPGNTEAHCGTGGTACNVCMAPQQTCAFGSCLGASGGGSGGGSGAGGGSAGCTPVSLTGAPASAAFDTNVTIAAKRVGASPFNQATYELWWQPTVPALPHTEVFDSSARSRDCTGCVTYYETCTAGPAGMYPEASCTGRGFFAQSGSLTVTAASQATSGSMAGSTTDLTLVEWDFANDLPAASGACVTLPATTFNVTF